MSDDPEKRDEFIYTIIKERFGVDWGRIDTLDSKASGIIGFAGIIVSLESAFGGYLLEKIPKDNNYYIISSTLIIGLIFLAISIFCALEAYRIRDWTIVPDPTGLIENYAKKDRNLIDIIRITSWEISEAIKGNEELIEEKVDFIKLSFNFLVIGIIVNIIFVYILLI